MINGNNSNAVIKYRLGKEANKIGYKGSYIDYENGFMAINSEGTLGVKMNSENCFGVYSINDGVWTLMSSLDINGVQAGTLTMPGFPNFKVIIGKGPNLGDALGLFVIDTNISETPFFKIWYSAEGHTVLQKTQVGDMILTDENGNSIGVSGTVGLNATFT